jgi:hypothetical protein
MYDLRLYFAGLNSATMLSGDIMRNYTTLYSSSTNPLTFGAILLNGTSLSLRATPYFIKHDSSNNILTIEPTRLVHFGVHTLRFKVTDVDGYFYEHVVLINVRNRAPYFVNNITNTSYSTTFKNITTFVLPLR